MNKLLTRYVAFAIHVYVVALTALAIQKTIRDKQHK